MLDTTGNPTWPVEIWDIQTRQRAFQHANLTDGQDIATAIAWSPSGLTIAIIAGDNLWLAHAPDYTANSTPLDLTSLLPDSSAGETYSALNWSPDEKRLALLIDGALVVIDLTSQKNILQGISDLITNLVTLAWSPDSKSITTVDQNNNLMQWSIG